MVRGRALFQAARRDHDLRLMRSFYRISLLSSAPGRPAEIATRVLREFARAMGFRRAELVLLDRRHRLRRLASYGRVRAATLDPRGERLRDCPFGRSLVRRQQAVLHEIGRAHV